MTGEASVTRAVGEFSVTAISDGLYRGSHEVLLGIDNAECERLTGTGFAEPMFLAVNSYLIGHRGRWLLSDVGSGHALQPQLGKLPQNLRAFGVPPEAIDVLLITHLHSDHSFGLVDPDGKPHFPNAELIVHDVEAAYWLDRVPQPGDSERLRNNSANQRRVTAPYRDRTRRITGGEVLPGITAMLRPGHTPGHTNWLIQSGGERLLIWGDIVHLPTVQIPRTDVALIFDTDPELARTTRRSVLDWVAGERLAVAGTHLPFPGFVRIERAGDGFRYIAEA